MAYISKEIGNIYYGQQCSPEDIEIPDAPGQFYNWNGTEWIYNDEAAAIAARESAKQARATAIATIVVTTASGKTFDGDEDSQTRMSRATLEMQAANAPIITWTLADNSVTAVTLQELTEALILAGQRQTELWPIPV